MRRREFITLLGGTAASSVAWPLAARAQQPTTPMIGVLNAGSAAAQTSYTAALLQGLKETGHVDGRSLTIEYRYAAFQNERLPALAADLVQHRVGVIAALGGPASAIAAKAATATIPIVFVTGGDPVKLGLVASLNRPGGNITGVSFLTNALGSKRLELLLGLMPTAAAIGFLIDPTNPNTELEVTDMLAAANALKRKLLIVRASTESEVDAAFASLVQQRADALIVAAQAFFTSRSDQVLALTQRHALPTIYQTRQLVVAGGLMSYGTSVTDAHRQAGIYAGRILKGEKPADLPVMQSTRFELVINLKTAKALGLDVPPTLLALADEVIE
jgi:putative tryptophan/tyrosine transport system substrate-binding protein